MAPASGGAICEALVHPRAPTCPADAFPCSLLPPTPFSWDAPSTNYLCRAHLGASFQGVQPNTEGLAVGQAEAEVHLGIGFARLCMVPSSLGLSVALDSVPPLKAFLLLASAAQCVAGFLPTALACMSALPSLACPFISEHGSCFFSPCPLALADLMSMHDSHLSLTPLSSPPSSECPIYLAKPPLESPPGGPTETSHFRCLKLEAPSAPGIGFPPRGLWLWKWPHSPPGL